MRQHRLTRREEKLNILPTFTWLSVNDVNCDPSDKQVGDAGPILDVMAVMLESISNVTVMVRNTMAAVYRTAQIIASLPNHSYKNKARRTLFLSSLFSLGDAFNWLIVNILFLIFSSIPFRLSLKHYSIKFF